jgi:hypothetical protein
MQGGNYEGKKGKWELRKEIGTSGKKKEEFPAEHHRSLQSTWLR